MAHEGSLAVPVAEMAEPEWSELVEIRVDRDSGHYGVGDAVLAMDRHVGVVDLAVFGAFGLGDSPAMLLGTGALGARVLGVAYGQRRLYLE